MSWCVALYCSQPLSSTGEYIGGEGACRLLTGSSSYSYSDLLDRVRFSALTDRRVFFFRLLQRCWIIRRSFRCTHFSTVGQTLMWPARDQLRTSEPTRYRRSPLRGDTPEGAKIVSQGIWERGQKLKMIFFYKKYNFYFLTRLRPLCEKKRVVLVQL